jgi:predicted nucleic acid-binding Zn ribbon protein
MNNQEQKRQERGNLIVGIVFIVIILIGLLANFYMN